MWIKKFCGVKWHKVAQTAGWRGRHRPGRGGLCPIPVRCVQELISFHFFSFYV